MALTVIHERYPYRYVDVGILENGFPDFRIQKYNEDTGRYKDMYLSLIHISEPTRPY